MAAGPEQQLANDPRVGLGGGSECPFKSCCFFLLLFSCREFGYVELRLLLLYFTDLN